MDLRKQLLQYIFVSGLQSSRRLAVRAGKQCRDFLDRDSARVFPCPCASHPVAHGECKVQMGTQPLPDCPEMMNLECIKLKAQEGIFVIGPDRAAVSPARPLQAFGSVDLAMKNHWSDRLLETRKDGGQLKVHDAEATVGLPVGHVPNVGVIVAYSIAFKFSKQLARSISIQVFQTSPAVSRNDTQFCGIDVQQTRHEAASTALKMSQHANFVVETLLRARAVESFLHPPVETDLDGRPQRILHLQHGEESLHLHHEVVKRFKNSQLRAR